MIANNPFAELSAMISPDIMQGYVVLMVLLVIGGTIFDMMHKKSAQYFFENSKKAEKDAKRPLSGGEKAGLAVKVVANEVLTSAEFKSTRRRVSHLFTMYGFVLFVAATAVLIFAYPTDAAAPALWTGLFHLGALMLIVGSYWFWFFIRVDVASEGAKWYNFTGRGDYFIVGLMTTPTFALIWSGLGGGLGGINTLFFALFILSSLLLFGTVYWSKFAHMFFKPAAAFQKRVIKADGSREGLPEVPSLTDPATKAAFPDIPEYMGDNPPYMGHGIKREPPSHF